MVFSSYTFLFYFLPPLLALYYLIPRRALGLRNLVLLAFSLFFYFAGGPRHLPLMLLSIAINYVGGLLCGKRRRWALVLTMAVNLGLLGWFKYAGFVGENLQALGLPLSVPEVVLPIGISFFTFQGMSYVIDVYRGDTPPAKNPLQVALYIALFPQLVAGPIERPGNLIPQLRKETVFCYENVTRGLKIMAWGFYKKLVIATTMSVYVDKVYNDPQNHVGFAMVVATVMFAFQVYCDFSGYSDIAIGSAKMFGQDLMINFKSPYFAKSMKEFWSRWHISLSTWFRDYLYIPLGGNRVSRARHELNLFVTFVVSGLWHGANWTFVAWGGVHGALQVLENEWKLWKKKHFPGSGAAAAGGWRGALSGAAKTVLTFVAVDFAWIFFRANSIGDAVFIIRNMFRNCQFFLPYLWEGYRFLGLTKAKLAGIVIPLLILAVYDYFDKRTDVIGRISSLKTGWRWAVYVAFVTLTICLVVSSQGNVSQEFIYFQF